MPVPWDVHPPGYHLKLRMRVWRDSHGGVRKVQWQRNCFSNPSGHKDGAWKAIATTEESDVVYDLIEERGATHDPADDISEDWEAYQSA